MNDLTDPAGLVALSAGALALVALVVSCVLALRVLISRRETSA